MTPDKLDNEIPVAFVVDGDTDTEYWLLKNCGSIGENLSKEDIGAAARTEARERQKECPYDPDEEPDEFREWVTERREEEHKRDLEENFHYVFSPPYVWECAECGHRMAVQPKRNYDAPFRLVYEYRKPSATACPACEGKTKLQKIVPEPPNPKETWPPIRLNHNWGEHLDEENPLDSKISPDTFDLVGARSVIQNLPNIFREVIVFPPDVEGDVDKQNSPLYEIVACAAIASWRRDNFYSMPYIGFWGVENSGKTQALRTLKMCAYHGVTAAGSTAAGIARLVERYGASIFVDDVHDHLSDAANGSKMTGILKSGFLEGIPYIVCEREGEGVVVRDVFGLKAFSGERPFQDSLRRRCINIFMEQHQPAVPNLDSIEGEMNEVRNALLAYKLLFPSPPGLEAEDLIVETDDGPKKLSGGILQVFEPILRVAKQFDFDLEAIKEYAYEESEQHTKSLLGTDEALVAYALYRYRKQNIYTVLPKDIAHEMNIMSHGKPSPERVGHILKDFGLRRRRSADGMVLHLDDTENERRLAEIFRRYKCEQAHQENIGLSRGNDDLDGYGG